MVSSTHVGSLAARAGLLALSGSGGGGNGVVQRTTSATYANWAYQAIETLQTWYDTEAGLWEAGGTTLWWNSANCLTVLADFAILDPTDADALSISNIIANTYTFAQQTPAGGSAATVVKLISESGLVSTSYHHQEKREADADAASSSSSSSSSSSDLNLDLGLSKRGYSGFLDDYYDDEGWWALALIRSWDVTGEQVYLAMAESIFADMQGGTDSTCGGGIWWSKDRTYKNAIANELFLSVAAHLANRAPNATAADYLAIAEYEWAWFRASGMINANNTINDGLAINADGTCVNNGQTVWSYNQGVVLGGLVELAQASGNSSYLDEAETLAAASIAALSDASGVVHDSCEPDCGADGSQFKGVFLRNLKYLYSARASDAVRSAVLANANAVWADDRDASNNQLGVVWSGPVSAGGGPNATTQSSALDALVAAVLVA